MTPQEITETIDKAMLILRNEMKQANEKMLKSSDPDFWKAVETDVSCKQAIETLTKIKAKA